MSFFFFCQIAEKEAEANKQVEEKRKQTRAEKKAGKKFEKGGSEMQDMLARRLQTAKKRKVCIGALTRILNFDVVFERVSNQSGLNFF